MTKIIDKEFLALYHKKTWIQYQHVRQMKMHFSSLLLHRLFPLEYVFMYSVYLIQ